MTGRYTIALVVAAALAVCSAMLSAVLPVAIGTANSMYAGTMIVLGAYVLYLLVTAHRRAGRLVAFGAWFALACGLALLLSPLAFLAAMLVLMSAVRVLFHHPSLIGVVGDAALVCFGLGFAYWASPHGVGIAVWCFFLTQTLTFWLRPAPAGNEPTDFRTAEQHAQVALRALAAKQGDER